MDNEIISDIKSLGLDMISSAGSGHPGILLGAAPILYSLYAYHINVNPIDPKWFNRDRFVMSCGHGSALLYATLFMAGFSISLDDLKHFRHTGYSTPGHPEYNVTAGIDCSTGALGQGFANAVGMALGEKILKERYRVNSSESMLDYKVYALVSDGDLMEGISYEAASFAGNLKLNNLIVLYDSNDISLDGPITNTFNENVGERFKSMGWEVFYVKDGNNISELNKAINKAKNSSNPSFIQIKTKIGQGLSYEGTNLSHGAKISDEEISNIKTMLNVPNEKFYYNKQAQVYFRDLLSKRVDTKYSASNKQYRDYIDTISHGDKTTASYMFNNEFNYDLLELNWVFEHDRVEATRDSNRMFIEYLNRYIKTFVGGAADVGSTTKTYFSEYGDITKDDFSGNNIWYGVREHSMAAITNGLALVNLKPYCSTFLSFADYMKPAIRMAALMKLPVTYIFSHDSILIGQDGPTHQPIEQLAMLRSIPNMKVYRPADAKELLGCWQCILNSNHNPSSLILSRTEVKMHENTNSKLTCFGGYIYYKEKSDLEYVIVSSGTELTYARNIGFELLQRGVNNFRIVSMPSIEQYLSMNDEYKNELIPSNTKVIVIEAGSSFGWHRITNNPVNYITIDMFGISGTKEEVLEHTKFTFEDVKNKVFSIMNIK